MDGRWYRDEKKLFLGVIGGYYFQARIQELSLGQGGSNLKKERQAKKKKKNHTHTPGERESASVFILHCIS